jgi:hypothetical protein
MLLTYEREVTIRHFHDFRVISLLSLTSAYRVCPTAASSSDTWEDERPNSAPGTSR